jgi:tRNA(fMet)-specific endonuclease VapC
MRYLLDTNTLSDLIPNPQGNLPLEAPVDVHYADIRKHLSRLGTPIGPNDLFIAAHARALDICVVTGNVSEFARVPGLSVQNWLG